MSAEAPGAVLEGLCDLPVVPGAPNLVTDAMLAIMSAAGPADVEKLRQAWLKRGVEEGEEVAIEELVWDALGADEDSVAEGLRIFHGEEISGLCEQRGWAPAAFFRCSCSLMCFAELARTASGCEVLDSVTARLKDAREAKEAREAPTGEEPQGKRRRTEGGASDGTWLRPVADVTPALLDSVTARLKEARDAPTGQEPHGKRSRTEGGASDSTWLRPVADVTPAVLDSFLEGRQRREEAAAAAAGQSLEQVQLAVAAELIHNYGCCQKATLACLHQPIPAVVHVYSSFHKNDIRLAVCGAGEARCARRGPRRRAASRERRRAASRERQSARAARRSERTELRSPSVRRELVRVPHGATHL